MLDHDIAKYFDIETKRLNEQVKRNKPRFPVEFCFQLNVDEKNELVAICDRLKNLKHSSALPYVFTEQGVAMLSAVLKSETAIKASIQIMKAFISMRKFMLKNSEIFHRLGTLELKQIQTDNHVNKILKALENPDINKKQGIFFEGQIFDAYVFVTELIRKAKTSITIIDNYIDESVLALLSKRNESVKVTILTKLISKQLVLDVEMCNKQYPPINLVKFDLSHDRFIIIDEKDIYHIGASLKDLGKKWFAFSKLNIDPQTILKRIK